MPEITAQMVKELREKSGAGMMDCKKALTETEGDFNKAMLLLRERGAAIADKRSSRAVKEGLIAAHIAPDHKVGTLVELNCESDFVARNEDFKALVNELAKHAAALQSVEAFNDSKMPDGQTVAEAVKALIGKIGENMACSRAAKIASDNGAVFNYIHPPGRIGVLVEVSPVSPELAANKEFEEFARDIAMHVAATSPICVNRDQVPADVLGQERELYRKQALNEGKPEKIVDKIVDGRLAKFFAEACLLEQPFAKDPDKKVIDYVKENAKKFGTDFTVTAFSRLRLGETAEEKAEEA